jgi:hypothetical protein
VSGWYSTTSSNSRPRHNTGAIWDCSCVEACSPTAASIARMYANRSLVSLCHPFTFHRWYYACDDCEGSAYADELPGYPDVNGASFHGKRHQKRTEAARQLGESSWQLIAVSYAPQSGVKAHQGVYNTSFRGQHVR